MKNLQFLFSFILLTFVSTSFGQTTQANFSDESAIWLATEDGHVSTFTISANSEALELIKERYNGLGNAVRYSIESSNGNTHTITMTFNAEIGAVYLHKMLLYIGCQTVAIKESSMSMDDFMNFLMK